MKMVIKSWAAGAALTCVLASPVAQADVFASYANNDCLANQGGQATLQNCSMSRHNNDMRYVPGENVFYGPLRQGGQCLDVANNRLVFARCSGSKSQVWKLSGNGQLNNEEGKCVNASLGVGGCPHGHAFYNLTYKMVTGVRFTASEPPRGTPLAIRGNDLINRSTGQIVAAGGGNIVAAGGGNIVAAGGGNIVAAGGGNIVVSQHPNIARIVAAGGGN